MRVVPVDEEQGHVALGLALRHLANTGIYMMATAHPDDENNGLLVMLNRGQGYRTALATATRGNGGQNEIGPELFEPLGVLRTEELAALHRFDGAEQYFTRAVDFGYTIDINETLEQWGRDEIIGDYVRLIRTVRPDVISGMPPDSDGPGPARAPRRVRDPVARGVQGWRAIRRSTPSKSRQVCGRGSRRSSTSPPAAPAAAGATSRRPGDDARRPGRSTIRCSARRMRKSAPKRAACTSARGRRSCSRCPGRRLVDVSAAGIRDPRCRWIATRAALFDGIDTSIAGLAKFAGARPPKDLTRRAWPPSPTTCRRPRRSSTREGDAADACPAPRRPARGTRAARPAAARCRSTTAARYEIDFRLRQKEREFQQAALIANGIRVEALADDGVVVPGQPVQRAVIVANHGRRRRRQAGERSTVSTARRLHACAGRRPRLAGGGGRGGRGGAPRRQARRFRFSAPIRSGAAIRR